tara:strand:+ start:9066 stop:11501 length:2436 start_codon:yes stop_codon:yes gene_type:complete
MTLEQLVTRIRGGDVDQSIADFLAATPNLRLEHLAASCLQWTGADDVVEIILNEYLKVDPECVQVHWHFANMFYLQNRFDESLPHFRKVLATKQQVAICYRGIVYALATMGSVDEMRDMLQEAKREIPDGEHPDWQLPVRLNGLKAPHRTHLQLWLKKYLIAGKAARIAHADAPHVVTWHPLDVGSDLNQYRFRLAGASYGANATNGYFRIDGTTEVSAERTPTASPSIDQWTAQFTASPGHTHTIELCIETAHGVMEGNRVGLTPAPLPFATAETGHAHEIGTSAATFTGSAAAAGSEACYRFEYGGSPDNLSRSTPWQPVPGQLNGHYHAAPRSTPNRFYFYGVHFTSAPGNPPEVECHWPFGQDPNHVSGIGFGELLFAAFPNSCQTDGYQQLQDWEGADMRDAQVSLRLATKDFNTRDARPCFGIGSRRACWMLTEETFTLAENGDTEIKAVLSSDRGRWTFAGNNPHEQSNADRYGYEPFTKSLANHIGNIFVFAPFGNIREMITGTMVVKDFSVTFRDKSAIHMDSGARLVQFPTSSTVDPKALTNGVRDDDFPGWFQLGPVGETPPTFVWELAKPMEITNIILLQDIFLPTKMFRLTITGPSVSDIAIDQTMPTDLGTLSAGHHFHVNLQGAVGYTRVKLELLEGATDEGLGLQAVEVFAKDYIPPASWVPVGVVEDADMADIGARGYYRMVCKSGDTVSYGNIREFALPKTEAPLLHTASVYSIEPDKTAIRLRINPMGHSTVASWRLDVGTAGQIPCGWENVAAHRYITIHEVPHGERSLTVVLESEKGKSREVTVTWIQES